MSNERATVVPDFIGELDGGVFENKISMALSEVAFGVLNNGQKGKVVITLDIDRMSNSVEEKRVMIKHKLAFVRPPRAVSRLKKTPPKRRCMSIAAASSPSCRKTRGSFSTSPAILTRSCVPGSKTPDKIKRKNHVSYR